MPAEITMPQLSDTMTEGTIVKWLKKEGEPVKAGEIVAEVETDKATMEMESFESGTMAAILIPAGQKAPVGAAIALLAKAGEKVEDIKKSKPASGAAPSPASPATAPTPPKAPAPQRIPPTPVTATASAPKPQTPSPRPPANYNYDLIVIGGGPAGYAAAIRAAQLKKRVFCIEKENLGGTCLNWGCIPTKALVDSGAFVRKLRDDAAEWGVTFDNLKVDFGKSISRSREIAGKLNRGIGTLFKKYQVKHEIATAKVVAPHKVEWIGADGKKDATAQNILVCTGARARDLPNIKYDGKKIISSREAMVLAQRPARVAIIGAGAIGCEFADFYSAMGSEVTIIEMLDHLLPIEDEDCSILLERLFAKRGIKVLTKTKTDSVDTSGDGVKLKLTTPTGPETVAADVCLLAVGVTGNIDGLFGPDAPVELFKNHIKVVPNEFKTNVEGIYAAGDVIGPPWLAHVAHHEAVYAVEKIFGVSDHHINYDMIPGCTYTHPQVASIGLTEKKAREKGLQIKIGKFPFSASGRAMAAGETAGFVKLIFDAKYGGLVGAHMIGEDVTELLAELVVAQKLEATESEIIEAMHPHPTLSEALMEAAGVADGRAIHI
ncbi:MAG: dihydrolipoyl dehydrogenase [Burkholderiales bacterium]|nr:dihydrolipoyl dehydrogenase [Phycisphaerae bacterium]